MTLSLLSEPLIEFDFERLHHFEARVCDWSSIGVQLFNWCLIGVDYAQLEFDCVRFVLDCLTGARLVLTVRDWSSIVHDLCSIV